MALGVGLAAGYDSRDAARSQPQGLTPISTRTECWPIYHGNIPAVHFHSDRILSAVGYDSRDAAWTQPGSASLGVRACLLSEP